MLCLLRMLLRKLGMLLLPRRLELLDTLLRCVTLAACWSSGNKSVRSGLGQFGRLFTRLTVDAPYPPRGSLLALFVEALRQERVAHFDLPPPCVLGGLGGRRLQTRYELLRIVALPVEPFGRRERNLHRILARLNLFLLPA
jgi:hypothetical protein